MDNREFLNKIRRLQESGQKIGLTDFPVNNQNNIALLMESKAQKLIKEEEIQTVEPDEQKDEENKFKDIVSKLVKFNPIKVHKENVEWSGHLIREKIDWTFSLDDTIGCYVYTTELIQLRDEVLEVLKKLRGYYDVWSDEWSGRLTGSALPDEESEFGAEEGAEESEFGAEEGTEEGGFGTEEGGF
tara:strand:+ start:128 stop:685 length:558 start_codon:yes stop_codon:yes gene_type:complete